MTAPGKQKKPEIPTGSERPPADPEMPEAAPGKALGGDYFQAAGIVIVVWCGSIALLDLLAKIGLLRAEAHWLGYVVLGGSLYVLWRLFRQYDLRLKHLSPFAGVALIMAFFAILGA
ncbi:MAG: hypothetical protein ACPGOV_17385 [Magnetovibrionaceae bacterium]